jgi:hypothetical protein
MPAGTAAVNDRAPSGQQTARNTVLLRVFIKQHPNHPPSIGASYSPSGSFTDVAEGKQGQNMAFMAV